MMLGLSACGSTPGKEDPAQYIIDVTGAPAVLNCSKSYTFAGHYAIEENDTVRLAVAAGDLMYLQFMGEGILCYRYNPSDGLNLTVRYDTIYDRYYMNNELISISLSEGSAAWDWLAGSDEEVLAGIRSLQISLPLSEPEINILKEISGTIPHPGLFIEGDSGPEEILSAVKPGWLIAEDMDFSTLAKDIKADLDHLTLLWHSGVDPVTPDFLYGLPALKSLIIEFWDSSDISDLQFERLRSLESLTIMESDIHDLSHIAAASKISNLSLIHCETLHEIGPVADLANMASLGLTGCNNINDIHSILQMRSLTRLSVPGNTSQEEFADIISRHDALQVLEMIGCDSIKDLSPLEGYTGLKALTLDFNLPDLGPVYHLAGLELLVLPEELFEDSLAMAEIQRAMPGTRVVAGGGFCLGSGWVLLLVPAVIILTTLRKRLIVSHLAKGNQ